MIALNSIPSGDKIDRVFQDIDRRMGLCLRSKAFQAMDRDAQAFQAGSDQLPGTVGTKARPHDVNETPLSIAQIGRISGLPVIHANQARRIDPMVEADVYYNNHCEREPGSRVACMV